MTTPDPELNRAVVDLVHEVVSRSEAQDAEEAVGWILVTSYPGGRDTYNGVYGDPISAMRAAEQFTVELNRGVPANPKPGDEPWTVRIAPLQHGPGYPDAQIVWPAEDPFA